MCGRGHFFGYFYFLDNHVNSGALDSHEIPNLIWLLRAATNLKMSLPAKF